MQHIFIINPNAGRYNPSNLIDEITAIAKELHISYQILETKYPHHATSLAKEFDQDDNLIYAIGGDGSAYDIINGIHRASLAIIPFGTGNDFYRMIAPKINDLKKMIRETVTGNLVSIDHGRCNDHYFLNTTTIGIDAKVNDIVCQLLKKTMIPKILLYLVGAIMAISKPEIYHADILLDNQTISKECLLIAIMNGKYYGNGVSPFKNVDIQDGYFDVCIIDKMPRYKLLWYLPRYFLGKVENVRYIHIYRAKKLDISVNKNMIAQSDGETFFADKFHLENLHCCLQYQLPKFNHFYKNNPKND